MTSSLATAVASQRDSIKIELSVLGGNRAPRLSPWWRYGFPNPINQKGHNMNLTPAQYQKALMRLSLFHILIITPAVLPCAAADHHLRLPHHLAPASRSSSWPPI